MKLSDILLLTLFFVMGAMIFAIKQMQASLGEEDIAIPVPAIKPQVKATPETSLPKLRLDMSTPETAGSYGRLSLDEFLAKGSPETSIGQTAPKNTAKQMPAAGSIIKRPRKDRGDQAALFDKPDIQLSNLQYETAEPIKLPTSAPMETVRFMDQVVHMAEASPLQPDSRGCGTLKHDLKSASKHAKVRSVGMERQLTERTSIGVEYVYKDGCYKNAIAPLNPQNMPSDDGVNLRVNMRF
ncbi:MAG: hypothetical protein ABJN69_10485 [Hellea sp.]